MTEHDEHKVTGAEGSHKNSKKRDKNPWPWRLVSFLIGAVVAALISISLAKGITGGSIQPFDAQSFVQDYFNAAVNPKSVEQAWMMLSPDFRHNAAGGYKAYLAWYKMWRKVVIGEIQPTGNNLFSATVTYIGANKQPSISGSGVFSLACTSFMSSYNPLPSSCSVGSIRMDYYGFSNVNG